MPDELLKLSMNEKEEKAIWESQHYSILYRYRNFLVHELRQPGEGMEFMGRGKPCYHGYIKKPGRWHILYPIEHFWYLVQTSINRMNEYFKEKQINPYDYFSDTERF